VKPAATTTTGTNGDDATGEELDAMTTRLTELVQRTGLDRTLAVGETILNRFFGGRPAAWRARHKNKRNSVRRLADRPGCPLGRSALNQAVGVYVAVQALPCVRTFRHIDASHIVAVLPLATGEQERWLRRAEEERWSVRRLRDELAGERPAPPPPERRRRPDASELGKVLLALKGSVRAVEHVVAELNDPSTLIADLSALRTLAPRLRRLETQLAAFHLRQS
jgi:hypothetical protein